MNVPEMFSLAATGDPARPFITYYDDSTGERTELSYLTLANWANKTANLLVDDRGLDGDSVAAVVMPAHWLTAGVLLGCWSAGLAVAHGDVPLDIAFVGSDRFGEAPDAPDVYGIALEPLAFRLKDAPEGIVDFLTEVRMFGDHFSPPFTITPDTEALVGLPGGASRTHGELVDAARARAAELGLADGARFLLAGERLRPLDWLLVPMAVRGSVVVCRNSGDVDLAKRAEAEKAVLVDVGGR